MHARVLSMNFIMTINFILEMVNLFAAYFFKAQTILKPYFFQNASVLLSHYMYIMFYINCFI